MRVFSSLSVKRGGSFTPSSAAALVNSSRAQGSSRACVRVTARPHSSAATIPFRSSQCRRGSIPTSVSVPGPAPSPAPVQSASTPSAPAPFVPTPPCPVSGIVRYGAQQQGQQLRPAKALLSVEVKGRGQQHLGQPLPP
eukprot:CAMPEP_0173267626 /NCGR_PEP_ID=MMETSP1142-20121109/29867_1 /TAXON_ID=483371 /ORGANISM="non described non described, Strain CCMP2298" /LENGTH=138 /DNA_ID=CAMNT_0014203761 /DNA_START=366 /DNA_END=778 /DNA_ORIENTATION=-